MFYVYVCVDVCSIAKLTLNIVGGCRYNLSFIDKKLSTTIWHYNMWQISWNYEVVNG